MAESARSNHWIGAVLRLTDKFNVRYRPIDGLQISTQTVDRQHFVGKSGRHPEGDFSGNVDADDLRIQMERDIGVTKQLGFEDMESLRQRLDSLPQNPEMCTLTVVVCNGTGLHHLYLQPEFQNAVETAYRNLTMQIDSEKMPKPSFVFCSGESVMVEDRKRALLDPKLRTSLVASLLADMQARGIPVEPGGFGHRDSLENRQSRTRASYRSIEAVHDRMRQDLARRRFREAMELPRVIKEAAERPPGARAEIGEGALDFQNIGPGDLEQRQGPIGRHLEKQPGRMERAKEWLKTHLPHRNKGRGPKIS
jgi:hypothetical protein